MIRKGEIRINSKRCKAQTKISLGDEIRLPPYLESEKRDNNFKNLPAKIEKLIKNMKHFSMDDIGGINFVSDIHSIKHENLRTRIYLS